MRDYGKVSPKFWTGETGQALARRGSEALVVALYLMTSPHSNMLGLYYQPVLYMAEETGLSPEGASKGLHACIEEGFCRYDHSTKMVWVIEMASYQVGGALAENDKRVKGIRKDYAALPNCPFLGPFFDRYAQAFHLLERRDFVPRQKGLPAQTPSPIEAPSKPGTGEGTGEGTGIGAPPSAAQAPSPAAPKRPAEPAFDPKGSRLPKDWALPADWAAWCEEHRPDLDPQEVGDSFRDFWVGKPGKDGRKTDWLATWRNWCRGQRPGSRKPGDQRRQETFV